MKHYYIIIALSVLLFTEANAQQQISYTGYHLVINEEFDSYQVDPFFWKDLFSWNARAVISVDKSSRHYYSPNGLVLGGNELILRATDDTITGRAIEWLPDSEVLEDGLPNRRLFDWQTGIITSNIPFYQGIFEVRCKIPSGNGFWPAFWLLGGCGAELDIFELHTGNNTDQTCIWLGQTDVTKKIHTSFHGPEGNGTGYAPCNCVPEGQSPSDNQCDETISQTCVLRNPYTWHTWAIKWSENFLEFYLDGKRFVRLCRYHDKLYNCLSGYGPYAIEDVWYPTRVPMYTKVNLGIFEEVQEKGFEGRPPDENTNCR